MNRPPDGYDISPPDITPLESRKIGIIGYGNQGEAWALNFFDSGLEVYIGLREGSPRTRAAIDKFTEVLPLSRVAMMCDIICALIPDESIPGCLEDEIFPHAKISPTYVFAHSYTLFTGQVKPPAGGDCILLAPHGPGGAVRDAFLAGAGLPAQWDIIRDSTGDAEKTLFAIASALGFTKGGMRRVDYRQEAVIDMFAEQAVLVGGMLAMFKNALDTLKMKGYDFPASKVSCIDEILGTAMLFIESGLPEGLDKVSRAAAFGATVTAEMLDKPLRDAFIKMLDDIESGKFSDELGRASSDKFKAVDRFRAELDKLTEP